MKKLLFFLFLAAISLNGFSQVRLTLDDCVNIALKNNLELSNKQLDIERQKIIKEKIAWSNFPSVTFGASHSYNYGFTLDKQTYRRTAEDLQYDDFYIRAGIDVFNISKYKRHNQARVDLERTKTDYQAAKNLMLLTIAQYYLDVMFNTEYVGILKTQLDESEKQIDRLNQALGFGYIARSELYDAEAEYSIDKKAVLLAENNRKRSILNLLNLINFDRDVEDVEFFDILFKIDTTAVQNKSDYYQDALKYNPDIKSAEYNLKSAKKEIGINRANGLPTLGVNYEYASFYNKYLNSDFDSGMSFKDQIDLHTTQYIGAAIRIPFFEGLQNQHNIKLAKIDYEKAKVEEEIAKDNLNFAIQQTIQDLENAISAYQTSLNVLNAARESFRTSRLKYEQGKINAFDFATAKKNLLQTEFDLLDSKFKLYFNRTKLNVLTKNAFNP